MVNHHEIEELAYELYQRDGCIQGRELHHWLEAERIFHARQGAFAETKPSFSARAAIARPGEKTAAVKGSKTVIESIPTRTGQAEVKAKKSGTSQKEATL
jgi:hypothetical protein